MVGYIVRRVLASIPVLLVVGIFAFLLLRLAPGDPAAVMAGPEAPADQVAKMREALGIDQPIPVQFVKWIGQLGRGEFGNSYRSGDPVLSLIVRRIEPTLSISILAQSITIVVAVPLGVLAAFKAHTWIDRSVMIFAVVGFSMPIFWLGFILMTIFGIWSFGLLEATLSFLGAGVPPSTPSWGNIMAESKGVMQRAVWTIMFPGFFLAVTVLAVNLVGDGLRDASDPRTSRVARPEQR